MVIQEMSSSGHQLRDWGDNYRGGYATAGSGLSEGQELRVAASTFTNYVSGTVQLVFIIFFVFLLISLMTLFLMVYARYLHKRKPKSGFYNPPDMITRYPKQPASNFKIPSSRTNTPGVSQSRMTLDSQRTAMSSEL